MYVWTFCNLDIGSIIEETLDGFLHCKVSINNLPVPIAPHEVNSVADEERGTDGPVTENDQVNSDVDEEQGNGELNSGLYVKLPMHICCSWQ